MDTSTIYDIAKKLRLELVDNNDDDLLEGYCLEASRELFNRFKKAGFNPELVQGTVEIDIPVFTDDGDEVFDPLHYWVQVDNYLVDITCSQFRQYMEDDYAIECMEDVLVENIVDAKYHTYTRHWNPNCE